MSGVMNRIVGFLEYMETAPAATQRYGIVASLAIASGLAYASWASIRKDNGPQGEIERLRLWQEAQKLKSGH
jgi:hypothetical protein